MSTKIITALLLFSLTTLFPAHFTNGAVAQKLDYLPFGVERINAKTGVFDTHFTFTDQEKDAESGLLYYGARYYHPRLGRFLQVDPVVRDNVGRKEFSLALANPQLLNGYSYVGNNPLRYTDENGEFLPILVFYAIATADIWVPAVIVGVGAIGGSIASWHLGGALGYYSEKDYANGDASLDASIFASTTTGEVAGGLVGLGDAIGAGGSGQKLQSTNNNQSTPNNNAETQLPDSALVVRGGSHTSPESFKIGIHPRSGLKGFSVESKAGADLCELCANVPNNQVRTTTVKSVRAAGGDVIPTKGTSPNHATVTNLKPQTANKVFSQPIKNPVPKASRVIRR